MNFRIQNIEKLGKTEDVLNFYMILRKLQIMSEKEVGGKYLLPLSLLVLWHSALLFTYYCVLNLKWQNTSAVILDFEDVWVNKIYILKLDKEFVLFNKEPARIRQLPL